MSDSTDTIAVVRETERFTPQIADVVTAAFGRDVESRLVDGLREADVLTLSMVAVTGDDTVVGHVGFSPVTLETGGKRRGFAASGVSLAPVAVHPDWQNRGIGMQLCELGLNQIQAAGHDFCVVIGHPDYYPRFGFQRAFDLGFEVDFPIPEEQRDAFMIKELRYNALHGRRGKVVHHPVFHEFA